MDETSCPVCWEEFSDLIGKTYILEYLPCHHHICQACYNSMHTSHICPLCRGTMISLVSILIYLSNLLCHHVISLFYSMLKCLRMVNGDTSIEMCMEEPPNKDGDTLQIQEVFSDKFLTS